MLSNKKSKFNIDFIRELIKIGAIPLSHTQVAVNSVEPGMMCYQKLSNTHPIYPYILKKMENKRKREAENNIIELIKFIVIEMNNEKICMCIVLLDQRHV